MIVSSIPLFSIIASVFSMSEPVIIVHGGAWAVPDHLAQASRRGVKQAAITGHQVLQGGGTAMEAVIASVKVIKIIEMERDPVTNSCQKSKV